MIKSIHKLAKEFPNKTYNELDKMRLNQLPKLKQDIVKSIFQVQSKKKYGDLVENIIKRKMSERTTSEKSQDELEPITPITSPMSDE